MRRLAIMDDIDMGRLNILAGIAPLKPAEFVLFRISQKKTEARGDARLRSS